MYYPYNTSWNKFEAVIHQAYLCIKIPATLGVITIGGHQNDGRNLERGHTPGQRNVHALDEAVESNKMEKQLKADREKIIMQPDCETKRVLLDAMVLDQTVTIGSDLSTDEEANLVQFLQKNKDVFAWSAKDLTGVDRSFIEHKLNIDPSVKPRKQKLRKMSDDKVVAVKSEVQSCLTPPSSARSCTLNGWPTRCLSRKRMANGECVSTSLISTRPHQKTIIHCHEWIKLWILRPTPRSCLCWIASLDITSVGWRRRMRKK
jgi:hypothetical protein